jgi:hypothetical protein
MRKFVFESISLLFVIFCIPHSWCLTLEDDDGKLKLIGVEKLKAYLIGSNLFAAEILNSINSNLSSEPCKTMWNKLDEKTVYKCMRP